MACDIPRVKRAAWRAHASTPDAVRKPQFLAGDHISRSHRPANARTQKQHAKESAVDPTADLWLVLDLHEPVHVAAPDSGDFEARYARPPHPAGRLTGRQTMEPAVTLTETIAVPLDPTTEEYSIAVAASLGAYFLEQGKSVGLIAWGQHKVTLPADRGGRQLVKILRALAVLRAEGTVGLGDLLTAESRHFSRQD